MVVPVEVFHGLGEFVLELPHLFVELADAVLPDEPDARFRIRQANALTVAHDTAANGSDRLEGRMRDVQKLLPGGKEGGFGAKGLGGFGLLLGGQGFAGAEPGDGDPHGSRRGAATAAQARWRCAHGVRQARYS